MVLADLGRKITTALRSLSNATVINEEVKSVAYCGEVLIQGPISCPSLFHGNGLYSTVSNSALEKVKRYTKLSLIVFARNFLGLQARLDPGLRD